MKRKLAILLGGAMVLAACATNPPPPPPAPPAPMVDPNNPLFAPGFLSQAGSANQWEIAVEPARLASVTKCRGAQLMRTC